jgi:hypothetical protein
MCKQYDELAWLSYSVGRAEPAIAAAMKSHSEWCEECGKQLEFSRKIAGIIDLNSAGPPDSWSAEAVEKFKLVQPSKETSDIFGNLVFDSYIHNRGAVRSGRTETRHLIFDLPAFEVDCELQFSGTRLKAMMGHLVAKTADSLPNLPEVSLELRIAAATYSTKPNELGEFLFPLNTQITGEPLELRCTLKEEPCAIVLIPC